MAKSKKYIGAHEKAVAMQQQELMAVIRDASPTELDDTPLKADENHVQRNDKGNAPALPKELLPSKTDYGQLINWVVGVVTILGFFGGAIYWLAKLDSKVDLASSDIGVIKPKVDQLLINTERQDVRIDNLEEKQSVDRKKLGKN